MTKKVVKNRDRETHYGIAQSFERIPGQTGTQPDRAGETGRRVQTDDQPYREGGDYSPSVTLALKLAKICQVKVEDIFEYEEDES